jgi:glyoxylase-like metal-dependent hydrolase (beta-lactamase superfamily II)
MTNGIKIAMSPGVTATCFHRHQVGSIEVTVIPDGVSRLQFDETFVRNASKAEVNAALIAVRMQADIFVNPYNPVVINTGGKLALIDTGRGCAAFDASNGMHGQLLKNLATTGIDPNAIATVIISHYHRDHIDGLLRSDGSLAFPNAEILVPAREHQYWMDDGEMSRAPKGRIAEVFKNVRRVIGSNILSRLRTFQWNQEVISGVVAIAASGHSPGHTSFVVTSGTSTLFVQADLTHAPVPFVRHPGWHPFYDHEPLEAEKTRRRMYEMLIAERMPVQGFHFPFPSIAYIEKRRSGYREIPIL